MEELATKVRAVLIEIQERAQQLASDAASNDDKACNPVEDTSDESEALRSIKYDRAVGTIARHRNTKIMSMNQPLELPLRKTMRIRTQPPRTVGGLKGLVTGLGPNTCVLDGNALVLLDSGIAQLQIGSASAIKGPFELVRRVILWKKKVITNKLAKVRKDG